jgi:hypothetical protein
MFLRFHSRASARDLHLLVQPPPPAPAPLSLEERLVDFRLCVEKNKKSKSCLGTNVQGLNVTDSGLPTSCVSPCVTQPFLSVLEITPQNCTSTFYLVLNRFSRISKWGQHFRQNHSRATMAKT